MSYILDALRKSEQQRQATEPDKVTERILVNPEQSHRRPTKWIISLVVSNLLVIGYLGWVFTQKKHNEPHEQVVVQNDQPTLEVAPPKPPVTEPVPTVIDKGDTMSLPLEKQIEQPALPSLAQLYEQKKEALKTAEAQKPIIQNPPKQTLPAKKETIAPKQKLPEIENEPPLAALEKPVNKTRKKGMPELNDLPYEFRNNLPSLNINVFSYDQNPDDRFVIIDMVKYKTGQLVKGLVTLREIRPDSIVLQYGSETFSVDMP
jgi:general secretion pathway protein B